MDALLEAIQAERDKLLAPIADQLAKLDEIEQIARGLDNGAATPVAAPPAPRKALPKRAASSGQGRDGLSAGAVAVLEALRAAGDWVAPCDLPGAKSSRTRNCAVLVERRLAEARGTRSNRAYRAVVGERKATLGVATNGMANGAPTRTQLGQMGSAARIVNERIVGQLKHRKLTEAQLAGILDLDRETIADACGAMLLTDRIVMEPDGRYTLPDAAAVAA